MAGRGERKSCVNQAYSLLARRAHSAAELRKKLDLRGYAPDEIGSTLGKLAEQGYIDDADFSRRYAAYRSEKARIGPIRLRRELSLRGVAAEDIESAVAQTCGDDERQIEAAMAAARKNIGTRKPDDDKMQIKRKLYGYLARKGFGEEIVRRVTFDRFDELFE